MSGIFGLFNQDGAPATSLALQRMASLLTRRGPDGVGAWQEGPIGLGHTLLATTPESLLEGLPLIHEASGCVITADARLDNRAELLEALHLSGQEAPAGDAGLLLAAYLSWGAACLRHLLGDFAFAIWDPRRRTLVCARDHFGMRPLYYHHSPGRFFAFASEPRAIVALPQAPYRINEARIADVLVEELEGVDKTSTFFEDVHRLPPAHVLTIAPGRIDLRRYWSPDAGPELRLPSDEAYAEAFLDVFTRAVRSRLRGSRPVCSMLSGGMDSGSTVAVAQELLAGGGRGPLPTFSATSSDPDTCVETRTIRAALTMGNLAPRTIHHGQLGEFMPELEELTWSLDEPFDHHMTLVRVLYLAARREGLNAMLDGAAGDTVLAEGSYVSRLIRHGRWRAAYREIAGSRRFWGVRSSPWGALCRGVAAAAAPDPLRRLRHRHWQSRRVEQRIRESLIHPDFALRVSLADRLRALDAHGGDGSWQDYQLERARAIDHPFLTVGRERYGRVAAAAAMEPRDPYLDLRVVAFCLALPGAQKLSGGWPKAILRRAMSGRLPDAVRWRVGKEHLGWAFTSAVITQLAERVRHDIVDGWSLLAPYVQEHAVRLVDRSSLGALDDSRAEQVYAASHLAAWLYRHARRPGNDTMWCCMKTPAMGSGSCEEQSPTGQIPGRPYNPPQLVSYGSLRDRTAGGSNGNPEAGSQAPTKVRP